jgi:hypothetical protein
MLRLPFFIPAYNVMHISNLALERAALGCCHGALVTWRLLQTAITASNGCCICATVVLQCNSLLLLVHSLWHTRWCVVCFMTKHAATITLLALLCCVCCSCMHYACVHCGEASLPVVQ